MVKQQCGHVGRPYRDKPRCAREAGHSGRHRDTVRLQLKLTREW